MSGPDGDGSLKRRPFRLSQAEVLKILRENRRREVTAEPLGAVPSPGSSTAAAMTSFLGGGKELKKPGDVIQPPNWEADFNRDMAALDAETKHTLAYKMLVDEPTKYKPVLTPETQANFEQALANQLADIETEKRLQSYFPSNQPRPPGEKPPLSVEDTPRGPTPGRPATGVAAGPLGGVMQWANKAKVYADKYQVPLDVVLGIMDIESGGRITATSEADAQSLMQVMPDNLRALGVPEDKFQDPDANIEAGVRMLADGFRQYGDWNLAAMNYYGPAAVANPDTKYYGVSGNDYKAKFVAARASVAKQLAAFGGGQGTAPGTGAYPTIAEILAEPNPWKRIEMAGKALSVMPDAEKYAKGLDPETGEPYLSAKALAYQQAYKTAEDMTASPEWKTQGKPSVAEQQAQWNTEQWKNQQGGQAPPGPLASAPGGPSFGYAGETRLPPGGTGAMAGGGAGNTYAGKSTEELYQMLYGLQGPDTIIDPGGNQQLTASGLQRKNIATEIDRREKTSQEDRLLESQRASTALGQKNYDLNVRQFEYGQGQDALNRQDALQKERNAIMKAKAEAENYLAQLEGQAQDRYSEAASWGIFPKGQPAPVAPSFEGLPGLDLNQYRVKAPDFFGPARTARDRIAQQFAAMKVGG